MPIMRSLTRRKKTPDAVRPVEVKQEQQKEPAVLELLEEACELELFLRRHPASRPCALTGTVSVFAVQLQFGGLTIKLLDEGKGKSSLSIGWSIAGDAK